MIGRFLNPGHMRASGAPFGAVREKGNPGGVAHQRVTVARCGQRDLGELTWRGLRNHGAVGEGEDGIAGKHHIERRAHQAYSGRGSDGPERRPYHVARRASGSCYAAFGFPQRHERRAEVYRIGGDVQRVHAIPDSFGAPLSKKLGDAAEPAVFGRIQAGTANHDGLDHAPGAEAFRRLLHSRIIPLAEDDSGLATSSPFQQLASKAHGANRRASAPATTGWTIGPTSPPNLATSRTRLELR